LDACLMKPIDQDPLPAAVERCQAPGAPADEPSAPAAEPPVPELPLVDEATWAMLIEMANRAHLAEWLQVGVQSYEEACAAMAGADAGRIAAEAHRIKGSAGTLGLTALRAAAAAVESAAQGGELRDELLQPLREVLARTRAELHARGLLDPAATQAGR
jgi:HPt (histidine-containing phosphotransfer) domain-containing protein